MNHENKHSDEFLKDLTKGKNPFKTPENYFDNLSENISVDIFEHNLPKKTGYKTPENYFENFKVNKPKSRLISLIPYISTAAVIAFGFFLFNNNQSNTINLDREDIINYLSYEDVFNTEELINNNSINTENILFTSLDNIDLNIDQLDMELNEYDITEY